ncbi:NAD(P)H-dependent D-xylose reductase xyl1 [Penicillium angulare]|uniref:D-xylose reductase [NAD(P)H] n=1 Tax=Penicillium angulare TaxID=116970 RepID=A0A9W9F509_9EURO|nr:NAD(P)H-dependent D-xylose reductase xyl1 [Penicillium angulare]
MTSHMVHLNSGFDMPIMGYGLWNISQETCATQVYNAIKAGYRCLDGACGKELHYGNEREAGQGVARAIEHGIVRREDLFIVSKLWGTFHDPPHVRPSIDRQLSEWGLEYFDLYLIHFPVSLKYVDPSERYPPGWAAQNTNLVEVTNVPIGNTWYAMEALVKENLTRSIGVSNFNIQLLRELICRARIPPAVLQIEHHPYLTQERLVNYCHSQGVAITAYCSFGPQSSVAGKLKDSFSFSSLLEHPSIKGIGRAHGKTPSQVLLRWSTQRGISVIPKSGNLPHMQQNLDMDWSLTSEQIEIISSLDQGKRFNDPVEHGFDLPIFD